MSLNLVTVVPGIQAVEHQNMLSANYFINGIFGLLPLTVIDYEMCKYAYCPVNVSRAVGPRCVDRAINNLSNDLEI